MNIYFERAKHSLKAYEYFNFDKLDAFHNQDVLSVIFGDNWYSVLITDEEKAFFHVFSKNKIPNSDYFDIEPFLGYAGPVVNNENSGFICTALLKYSEICTEVKIIAEIIRFNPLLNNHVLFNNSMIKVFLSKEIVITFCRKDKELQLREFSKSRKRDIKIAEKSMIFNPSGDIEVFKKLYFNSINKHNAKKEWFFKESLFDRIKISPYFNILEAKSGKDVLSSAIIIDHLLASYYFLAANTYPQVTGANDFLLLNACLSSAKKEIPYLILGGGNSAAEDDPLFMYKKKFTQFSTGFYMGKLIHDELVYKKMCYQAISHNTKLESMNYFLKYRL
jgi:hypothetical protein